MTYMLLAANYKLFLRVSMIIVCVFFLQIKSIHAQEWKYMEHAEIDWRNYDKQAFTEARIKNRPLFVFIFADWCEWCKKLELETLEKQEIRKLIQTKFIPVAIDYDKHTELAKKLGVQLVPTSIIITPDGKKLLKFFGFIKPADLVLSLNKTLAAWQSGELPEEEFGSESTCCPVPNNQ